MVDEWAASHARTELRESKAELKEISHNLFNDPAFGRTKGGREDIARRMNAAIVRLTTAQHWLGVYEDA